jgi:hypothetical protein
MLEVRKAHQCPGIKEVFSILFRIGKPQMVMSYQSKVRFSIPDLLDQSIKSPWIYTALQEHPMHHMNGIVTVLFLNNIIQLRFPSVHFKMVTLPAQLYAQIIFLKIDRLSPHQSHNAQPSNETKHSSGEGCSVMPKKVMVARDCKNRDGKLLIDFQEICTDTDSRRRNIKKIPSMQNIIHLIFLGNFHQLLQLSHQSRRKIICSIFRTSAPFMIICKKKKTHYDTSMCVTCDTGTGGVSHPTPDLRLPTSITYR